MPRPLPADWHSRRLAALERDGWTCRGAEIHGAPRCQAPEPGGLRRLEARRAKLVQVDHIIPRERGGSDHIDNLRSLCAECHRGRKSAPVPSRRW